MDFFGLICIKPMPRGSNMKAPQLLELPPAIALGFFSAMKDYFAETDPHKRDAIAAHQLSILAKFQNPREKKLRLSEVKGMFEAMRNILNDK